MKDSPAQPQPEALIERIRAEVQKRKGQPVQDVSIKDVATKSVSVQSISSKAADSTALKRVTAALDRLKAKEKTVRKWPKLLRSLRRNQQSVNESLLTSVENIVAEGWRVREMLATQAALRQELAAQNQALANQSQTLAAQIEAQAAQSQELVELFERMSRKFGSLTEKVAHLEASARLIETRLQPSENSAVLSKAVTSLSGELQDLRVDTFYLAFENQFRGSRVSIKRRLLLDYTSHLSAIKERLTAVTAVDIGCGRGEWLEVLRENGIVAHGVDQNTRMAACCTDNGLDAEAGDGIAYLQSLPDDSQAIISGFHIVEHLTLTQLLELFTQSQRVLRPGGIAIFETPNPECLRVSTYTFYTDPTHRNPIPPELLSFIGMHAGFSDAKTERFHPYCEEGVLKGYGDYAGIFTK